jgi:nicotinamide-nucleotide amidase
MSVASKIVLGLEERKLYLVVAESLTGGLLTAEIAGVAGASKVLVTGIVAYQSTMKHELLGVSKSLLENQGAVDPEVAAQMASGLRTKIASKLGLDESKLVGISTTGVAGPDEQDGKRVGTVYIAISGATRGSEQDLVFAHELSGNRQDIQRMTVELALGHLWEQIQG